MPRGRTLSIKVLSDVKDLDKLANAGQRLSRTGSQLTRNYTLPLVAAGTAAVKFASDLEEATSKASTVFTTESDRILKAAGNLDDAFSESTFLDTAGTFGALLQSMGLTEKAAADLSLAWLELSQDMASFHNTNPEEALGAIQSALAGEFEPLKRYGVLLNAALIEQRALEQGLYDGVGAIDAQTRALVINQELLRQQPKVLGDYERTADGVANSTRRLLANFEDAAASLGKELLPAATEFVGVLDKAARGLSELNPEMRTWIIRIAGVVAVLGPALILVGKLVEAGARLAPVIARLSKLAGPILAIGSAIRAIQTDFEDFDFLDFAASFDPFGAQTALNDIRDRLENELAPPVHDPAIEWAESFSKIQDAAFDGTLDVATAIEDGAAAIDGAMAELEDAVDPGSLADTLRAGIDDYDKALDELTETAVNSVSDLAERQKIEGILASQELTDALNSDSTRTRLLAIDLVNDLVADYELIAPGALEAGELVNPAMATGLESNLHLVETAAGGIAVAVETPLVNLNAYPWGYQVGADIAQGMWDSGNLISDAAYGLANKVSNTWRIESEPPDPNSPLYGHMKWGGNFARDIAAGLDAEADTLSTAASGLASFLVPPTISAPRPDRSAGIVGAMAGGHVTNINLTFNGDAPDPSDEKELVATLQRLAPFIDGRMAPGY